MTSLMEKVCQKMSFSARRAKLTLKSAFFWKRVFRKRSSVHIKWSAVLTTLRKFARQKSVKLSWAKWVKVLKTYSFYFLDLSVSLDSVGAIMLNLPINICHCLGIFPSSSGVIYSSFFTSENLWTVSLDKKNSVFSTLPAFFTKSQAFFCRQVRIIHEIIN